MDLISKLLATRLFQNISQDELKNILERHSYKILKFKKDEAVVFRGDEVKGIYINIDGILSSEMIGSKGEIKKIEDIEEGTIIASAFIFGSNSKFPVDLYARSEVQIFFIEKDEFLKILQENSMVIKNILDEISNKAQFLSSKIWHSLNNKTITQKTADYILKNMKDGEIKFSPSLNEVANLFNVARPSLSRIIMEFTEKNILERKGRSYIVKDKEKLLEEIN